jgi:GH24 family phage-related lysozyme (muramidase)
MISGPEFDAYLLLLDNFEGRVAWMYLDGAGNVSCGSGHRIPNADAAILLGLSPAEYGLIKAAPAGRSGAYYEILTKGRLLDQEIDSIKLRDLTAAWQQITARWPACETFPAAAQCVVLDMSYNMGAANFASEFLAPGCHFGPACERGDWAEAALQSERKDIQESRNTWAANALRSCAKAIT